MSPRPGPPSRALRSFGNRRIDRRANAARPQGGAGPAKRCRWRRLSTVPRLRPLQSGTGPASSRCQWEINFESGRQLHALGGSQDACPLSSWSHDDGRNNHDIASCGRSFLSPHSASLSGRGPCKPGLSLSVLSAEIGREKSPLLTLKRPPPLCPKDVFTSATACMHCKPTGDSGHNGLRSSTIGKLSRSPRSKPQS